MLLLNREGLVGEVAIGGHLGHSDHEEVEFTIFGDWRKTATKTSTLDIGRTDFRLLMEQLVNSPGIRRSQSLAKGSQGSQGSRQDPAALTRAADEAWAELALIRSSIPKDCVPWDIIH